MIKRVCALVENDMYGHVFSDVPANVRIRMTVPNKDLADKKTKPSMTFTAQGSAKLYFVGHVVTKPTNKSIEVAELCGCKIYITEPDFDSDSWCPAWAIPIVGKKETPTMLMKSDEACLELPLELQHGGVTELKVKMPYVEVPQCGTLVRPKMPVTDTSAFNNVASGPRVAFLDKLKDDAADTDERGQAPANNKRRKDYTPRHLKHILT